MIKFSEVKVGDYLMAEYEGQQVKGEVTRINRDEKQVGVHNGVQEFFFSVDHLHPIPLNEEELLALNFEREDVGNNAVKYKKGAFRIVLLQKGNFSEMEIWYREDRRHNPNIHFVHQLQNHYYDMTKVHLTSEAMA